MTKALLGFHYLVVLGDVWAEAKVLGPQLVQAARLCVWWEDEEIQEVAEEQKEPGAGASGIQQRASVTLLI